MSRSFLASCRDCGAQRRVRRHELLHRSRPRCLRCGGPLDLSPNAKSTLGQVNDAQRGEKNTKKTGKREEPLPRLIPVHETKRYDFWEYPDMYTFTLRDEKLKASREAIRAAGPIEFYRGLLKKSFAALPSENQEASELLHLSELSLWEAGKPYYKVWPSILEALGHTEMRIDGEFFHLPTPAIEIRLPKMDNPLAPVGAIIAAMTDARFWTDGRQASFVICFFDNIADFYKKDNAGNYWMADIPIRPGLSLEDALDQTALIRDCPSPELARRLMRVCVGVSFFANDRHEVILPEVPRRLIEKFQRERREPTPSEAANALQQAKDAGLFGWKVGSEIQLPTPRTNARADDIERSQEQRELTAGHIRRGHMRLQPCGERNKDRKLIFLAPTVVRPDLPIRAQHGYRVKL